MLVAFRRASYPSLPVWSDGGCLSKNLRRASRKSFARRNLGRARAGGSKRICGGYVEGRMSISRIEGWGGWRAVIS